MWREILAEQKKLNHPAYNKWTEAEKAAWKMQTMAQLLVNLSTLANAYAPFKYWKRSHVINQALLMTTFNVTLSDFAKIALALKLKKVPRAVQVNNEPSIQVLELFNAVVGLSHKFDDQQLAKALERFLGLQAFLKITDQAILDSFTSTLVSVANEKWPHGF